MMSSHHKTLLEQVLERVYGPEMQYHLLVGNERPPARTEPSVSKPPAKEDGGSLEKDIHTWFGKELPIKTTE